MRAFRLQHLARVLLRQKTLRFLQCQPCNVAITQRGIRARLRNVNTTGLITILRALEEDGLIERVTYPGHAICWHDKRANECGPKTRCRRKTCKARRPARGAR